MENKEHRKTTMKHSVGRNIARLRLSQGMTQERLAQRMGVTPQAVSKWENDLNYPDVAALPALAALLGTSVDSLLTVPDNGAEAEPEDAVPTRADLAASPASPASESSPAAPASTDFALMRPEPAPKQERGASAAAGRKLRIEIRGPRNNVDLAFPMQAVAALTSLTAAVPQARTAIDAHGLDLDAVLTTAFGSLDAVGRSTLLDITDGEDRVRLYVE
ncbi:helix-turn-helix domain-containing protein [uncultured Actinomyces sp.]|uniref:helix-turn-helix domain-containing protein n=1 Tax=uncultured Actinomyces sp. TaxID=249061 RepID=UPI002620DA3D|nr:helix-turn-helix transcriptional regulator [uncultured Actinomyces sp.]